MSTPLPDRADKLPPVPNDPAHPLRPFVTCWTGGSHIDARTWYGETDRDEFHQVKRITRVPRGRPLHGKKLPGERVVTKPEATFVFDDAPDVELDYEGFLARIAERHGEHARHPERHPLVEAWRRGEEIPFTPSPPAFPLGSKVRQHYGDLSESTRQKLLERDAEDPARNQGTIKAGNALFVLVQWPKYERWHLARKLEPIPEAP